MRLIIALAAKCNLKLYQLDIETAFLNGEIEEEVYMEKPEFLQEMLTLILKREDKNSHVAQKASTMLNNLKHGDMVFYRAVYRERFMVYDRQEGNGI